MSNKRRTTSPGTIRSKLNDSFVQALAADWESNGADVIKVLREKDVRAYSELIGRLIVAEANKPDPTADTREMTSTEIAEKLLADVGLNVPDDDALARALQAYDTLIATLEEIKDEALH